MDKTVIPSPQTAKIGDFQGIRTWVFDLDNTLYPVTGRLLTHIDSHMGAFIASFLNVDLAEARRVQKAYFRQYGLTMRGLMLHHGLDPVRYFEQMRPMDLTEVAPNPALADTIGRLAGRKIVYTNASVRHAEMVLGRLGMGEIFDAVFDIAAAGYIPKPALESYRSLCASLDIDPGSAVMIDDIARNLEPAAEIGITTVWMRTSAEWAREIDCGDHIDHVITDLAGWLEGIVSHPG